MLFSFPTFSERSAKLSLPKSYCNNKPNPTRTPDQIGLCNLNRSNLFRFTAGEKANKLPVKLLEVPEE